MKVVYIAGPYIGDGSYESIELNVRVAEIFAVELANKHIAFVCPHLNSKHFEDVSAAAAYFWYAMYLEVLRRCDAILLLPGWKASKGALKELELAQDLRLPVFNTDELNELEKWHRMEPL